MKTTAIILSLALLSVAFGTAGEKLAPLAAPAKAPVSAPCVPCLSYDYIDLDYGITNLDNAFLDDNGHRYGISFSKSLGEVIFLTGGYTNAGVDYLFNNQYYELESHRYSLGLGARFKLDECVDFTIEGGYDHRDVRFRVNNQLNYETSGYYVGPGIRARAGRFEGYAKAFYVGRSGVLGQYDADVSGWIFKPGFLFHLTDNFALKVAADVAENNSAVTFGARIMF